MTTPPTPSGRTSVFRWKGRTQDGLDLSGEIAAASREEALELLRTRGLMVSTIGGGSTLQPTSADLPPAQRPPVRELAPLLARERATGRRRPFLALLVAAGLALAGIGVGAMGPIVTYRCERDGGGRVSCTIARRPLGLFAWREQRLGDVTSVGYEQKSTTTRPTAGRFYQAFVDRLVLRDAHGRSVPLEPYDDSSGPKSDEIGTTEHEMEVALSNFLREPEASSVSGWRGHSVSLVVGGVPLFLAVVAVALTVLSSFGGVRRWVYDRAAVLAKQADERARLERERS